jgi:predicted phage-related endonuclease
MLTPAQQDARKGKLTASRVAVLMNGNSDGILRLWKEMIGEAQEIDLSDVWPVQLGIATEHLSLDWFERKNRTPVTRRGEVVVHPQYDWAACTLDGWIDALECCIECKHVGGREPLEVVIDRYQPQIQWQMECTAAEQCALSVIMGASEPIVEFIKRDDDYIQEMLNRGEQFMAFVERRTPPVTLPAVPPPVLATKSYDLGTNNLWASSAYVWLESHPHATACKDAEKTLKSLVPDDARKCFGAGVQITRDRAGRLSLKETP